MKISRKWKDLFNEMAFPVLLILIKKRYNVGPLNYVTNLYILRFIDFLLCYRQNYTETNKKM